MSWIPHAQPYTYPRDGEWMGRAGPDSDEKLFLTHVLR